MTDYSKGKIYKITNNDVQDIYIGSTVLNLNHRLSVHVRDTKVRKSTKTLEKMFSTDNYKIELIENYPCQHKWELLQREQYYKDNTVNCVNTYNALSRRNSPSCQPYTCIYCDCSFRKYRLEEHNQRKKHIKNVKYFDDLFKKFT